VLTKEKLVSGLNTVENPEMPLTTDWGSRGISRNCYENPDILTT
jgi:hypothetical protein